MLMRPDKAKTAAHGCFCPGDVAVRMRKVLATEAVGCFSSVSLAFYCCFHMKFTDTPIGN